MSKSICPRCDFSDGFLLMADYCASGLWCKKCGISFGNPKDTFPNLPSGLVDLIDAWGMYWAAYADKKSKWYYQYHHDVYCQAGVYLAKLVSEFCPCVFEDR